MNIKRQGSGVRGQGSDKKNSSLTTDHSRLIFILGGARSGKSTYALKLAESTPGKRLYLATAEVLDKEMAERIKKHKKQRGNNWTTIEEPIRVADVIRKNNPPSPMGTDLKSVPKGGQGGFNVILLDCLTIWISNLMHISSPPSLLEREGRMASLFSPSPLVGEGRGEGVIEKEINSLSFTCKKANCNIIIVSNEVGLGIVPDNPLARQFRDIAGVANQKMAEAANEVYFMVSGIAMKVK